METYLVSEAFAARLRLAVAEAAACGELGDAVACWPVYPELADAHEQQDCFFVAVERAQEVVAGNQTWRVELVLGCQVVGNSLDCADVVARLGEGCGVIVSMLRGGWHGVALDAEGCPATVLELYDEIRPPDFSDGVARYRVGARAYMQF